MTVILSIADFVERVHATQGVYRVCQCDVCQVYYWAEDTLREMDEQS